MRMTFFPPNNKFCIKRSALYKTSLPTLQNELRLMKYCKTVIRRVGVHVIWPRFFFFWLFSKNKHLLQIHLQQSYVRRNIFSLLQLSFYKSGFFALRKTHKISSQFVPSRRPPFWRSDCSCAEQLRLKVAPNCLTAGQSARLSNIYARTRLVQSIRARA